MREGFEKQISAMLACWGFFNLEGFLSVENIITCNIDLFSVSVTWDMIVVVLENT